jgi:hypothetical protein
MQTLIRNKGEADSASFWMVGESPAREIATAMGQFGSGAKHALLIMLRKQIPFRIFSGVREIQVGLETIQAHGRDAQVMTVDGHRTSISLNFGALDWTQASMAVRELVCNAIDQGTEFEDAVSFVGVNEIEGVEDETRIYIESKPGSEVFQAVANLPDTFLHASKLHQQPILQKSKISDMKIYRKGVLIQVVQTPSVFDYNDLEGQIQVNESRTLISGNYADAVRVALNTSELELIEAWANVVMPMFKEMHASIPIEFDTDRWGLKPAAGKIIQDKVDVLYDCRAESASDFNELNKMNYRPALLLGSFIRNCTYAMKDLSGIKAEKNIPQKAAALMTSEHVQLYHKTAATLAKLGHINSDYPYPKGFKSIGGRMLHGFVDEDRSIWLNVDQISIATIIEELLHWQTGYSDFTREFQECIFKLAADLLKQSFAK